MERLTSQPSIINETAILQRRLAAQERELRVVSDDLANAKRQIAELNAQLVYLRSTLSDTTAELDLPRLLRRIINRVVGMIGAQLGMLLLFDDEQQVLSLAAAYSMLGEAPDRVIWSLGSGVIGQAAAQRRAFVINHQHQWRHANPLPDEYIPSCGIAAPLVSGDQLIGVMVIGRYDRLHQFDDHDLEVLEPFTQQATVAIRNAWLFHATMDASRRRARYIQAAREIEVASTPQALYTAIHTAVSDLMPSDGFVISLFDHETDQLTNVYQVHGEDEWPTYHSLLFSNPDESLKTAEPLLCESGIERSLLFAPIRQHDHLAGALLNVSYQPHAFTATDRETLELLAALLALALQTEKVSS